MKLILIFCTVVVVQGGVRRRLSGPQLWQSRTSSASINHNFQAIHFPTSSVVDHRPVFPTNQNPQNFHPLVTPTFVSDISCHINQSLVPFRGECRRLLSKLSCEEENHWLIIDGRTLTPKCIPMVCPVGYLFYRGNCVSIEDNRACGINEIFYIEHHGEVTCDCQSHYIFDGGFGQCREEGTRGSCPHGQYLRAHPTSSFSCVFNICQREGLVYNEQERRCFKKLYMGFCDISQNYVTKFDLKKGTVDCIDTENRNIFNVPSYSSCPPGSRKDYFGRCQATVRWGSTGPFSQRVPSVYSTRTAGRCPSGYTKLPNNTCKLINRIFG